MSPIPLPLLRTQMAHVVARVKLVGSQGLVLVQVVQFVGFPRGEVGIVLIKMEVLVLGVEWLIVLEILMP